MFGKTLADMMSNAEFVAAALILNLCVLLMLQRTYRYVKLAAQQLTGIPEASLEVLQRSSESSLPGLRLLMIGLGVFAIREMALLGRYWKQEITGNSEHWPGLTIADMLVVGAVLSGITYGFILYVKALEEYKPAYLWRPFDRMRFQGRFDRRFRNAAIGAMVVAVALALAWAILKDVLSVGLLRAVYTLWHLALLGLALKYLRWSNLGFRPNVLAALSLWALAVLLAGFGWKPLEQVTLVIVMLCLVRFLMVDAVHRLSDLGGRCAKISRDKNIILSFLRELAGGSDTPEPLESSFDLKRLMRTTLDFAMKQTQASASAVFLVSEKNPGELFAAAVEGAYPPQQDLALGRVAVKQKYITDLVLAERIALGQGLVGEVAVSGEPVRIDDASQDRRIRQSKEGFLHIRNQLVVPLKVRDRVEGVLSVINRGGIEENSPPFDVHDEALLLAVGEQAAIALNSVRMHKILAEQEILEREIQIAQEVQRLLLPEHCPIVPGFDMGAFSRSARRVGGDYYDFLWIDEQHLAVVVADVAGKGVPGALTMAMVRSALKAQVRQSRSAREILTEMNQFVYQDTKAETFVSMFLAILDIHQRTATLARAGHEPLIYLPAGNDPCRIFAPEGMALGMDGGTLFRRSLEEVEIPLQPGDTLILYTDGITEAMNAKSQEFTLERFVDTLQCARAGNAIEILEAVRRAVSEFTGDLPQHDDLTLMLVKVVP